ncbi:MAG: hypothetical protein K1X53_15165 [Candidatus Sumerlaeaceae bacterium]|nr:hypothetical protein [Candidatus Sumerlaeaceae bacterium]
MTRMTVRLVMVLLIGLTGITPPAVAQYSPALNDPGMGDYEQQWKEQEARYQAEQRLRNERGRGSVFNGISAADVAGNDTVTGVAGATMEKLAATAGSKVAGSVLGNIPVDGVAQTLGHAVGGDSDEAAWTYATTFVSGLVGYTGAAAASAALAGVTAPAWLTGGAVLAAGIGAGYIAKTGMGYLRQHDKDVQASWNATKGKPGPKPQPAGSNPSQGSAASKSQPTGANPAQGSTASKPAPKPSGPQMGACRICGKTIQRARNDDSLCLDCAAREAARKSMEQFQQQHPNFGRPR